MVDNRMWGRAVVGEGRESTDCHLGRETAGPPACCCSTSWHLSHTGRPADARSAAAILLTPVSCTSSGSSLQALSFPGPVHPAQAVLLSTTALGSTLFPEAGDNLFWDREEPPTQLRRPPLAPSGQADGDGTEADSPRDQPVARRPARRALLPRRKDTRQKHAPRLPCRHSPPQRESVSLRPGPRPFSPLTRSLVRRHLCRRRRAIRARQAGRGPFLLRRAPPAPPSNAAPPAGLLFRQSPPRRSVPIRSPLPGCRRPPTCGRCRGPRLTS